MAIVILVSPDFKDSMREVSVDESYLVWMFGSYLGCLSLVFIFRKFGNVRLLAFIGRHSMLYYVTHWTLLLLAQNALLRFRPEISPELLTLCLFLSLLASMLCLTWARKWLPKAWLGEAT